MCIRAVVSFHLSILLNICIVLSFCFVSNIAFFVKDKNSEISTINSEFCPFLFIETFIARTKYFQSSYEPVSQLLLKPLPHAPTQVSVKQQSPAFLSAKVYHLKTF